MFMKVNQRFDRNLHGFFMRRTLSSHLASFGLQSLSSLTNGLCLRITYKAFTPFL